MAPTTLLTGIALFLAQTASAGERPLSLLPWQRVRLAEAQRLAEAASSKAEAKLLERFGTEVFRLELIFEGATDLARRKPEELLALLKATLAATEYTSNFGVSEAYRNDHPGQPSMNFKTLGAYGYIPNMWELRCNRSDLVKGIPWSQWMVLDTAETTLYGLPAFAKPVSEVPAPEEARGRIQYVAANTRLVDLGVERYGSFVAVLRGRVLSDRTLLVSSDSGGLENACNKSLPAIKWWMPYLGSIGVECDGIYEGGIPGETVVVGVPGHELHTVMGNSMIFGRTGGGLARLMYQMLSPGATVRPLEKLMYFEGGVLGPIRLDDLKLIVASFPDVFGTSNAIELRQFCKNHSIPLVWGLGNALSFDEESKNMYEMMPFAPIFQMEGRPRLVDPSGWAATNVTMPPSRTDAAVVWERVEAEMNAARRTNSSLQVAHVQGWWGRLVATGSAVRPLRASDCASTDLCFGTISTVASSGGDMDMEADLPRSCVCRRSLAPEVSGAQASSVLI